MPIQIVEKKKTEPSGIGQHNQLVPLRIVGFASNDYKRTGIENKDKTDLEYYGSEVGDIVFSVGSKYGGMAVINATRGTLIDVSRHRDDYRVIRAYEVAQIVLMNDDSPAPVT